MATLTLTVGANADDREVSEFDDPNSGTFMRVGAVGSSPLAGHGHGWRFTNVTLTGADTINTVYASLYKDGSQWAQQNDRWTFQDVDNASSFSGSSPNRPGDPAIVSASIADESHNVSHSDNTRYGLPSTTTLRQTLAAALSAVLDRSGWSSGNAVALVCNSDQDASAYTGTQRKNWAAYEHTDANSEPQLVIDYTAGAAATSLPIRRRAMRVWTRSIG